MSSLPFKFLASCSTPTAIGLLDPGTTSLRITWTNAAWSTRRRAKTASTSFLEDELDPEDAATVHAVLTERAASVAEEEDSEVDCDFKEGTGVLTFLKGAGIVILSLPPPIVDSATPLLSPPLTPSVETDPNGPRAKSFVDAFPDTEVSKMIAAYPWETTPLGPIEEWTPCLKVTVAAMLASPFRTFLYWSGILIYNDAYTATLAQKHPEALGAVVEEVWSEVWFSIGISINKALSGNVMCGKNDELPLIRDGLSVETFQTYTFGPINDETGLVVGAICVHFDSPRRPGYAVAVEQSGNRAVKVTLRGSVGVPENHPFHTASALVDLTRDFSRRSSVSTVTPHPTEFAWPFDQSVCQMEPILVEDLEVLAADLGGRAWGETPRHAVVQPIWTDGADFPAAVLVFGVNPRSFFKDSYKSFTQVVARQVGIGLLSVLNSEADTARANDLISLDRAKTSFFSNTSHELRTPLTLITGPLEDIIAGDNVTESLLDFSAVEGGRAMNTFYPVELGPFTAQLASLFRDAAERGGLTFTVQCDDDPLNALPTYISRELYRNVIFNLLGNALKYCPSGGISVRLRSTLVECVLEVTDSGIGIPPEELSLVFERFHRVENLHHSAPGTGIATGDYFGDLLDQKDSTILLSEDSDDLREYISGLLGKHYHVVAVPNGQDALEYALQHPPSLVLSDVQMPRLGGQGLLDALRSNARTALIPVIFLSAAAVAERTFELHESIKTQKAIEALHLETVEQRAADADTHRKQIEAFIDITSHELRNPLSGVWQNAECVKASLEDTAELVTQMRAGLMPDAEALEDLAEEIKENLEGLSAILLCAAHQGKIADDILNVSKLNVGLLTINRAHFDLVSKLKEVVAMFEAGISLRLETDHSVDTLAASCIVADPSRIAQVVVNLLLNSAKFTPFNGTITINLSASLLPPPLRKGTLRVGQTDLEDTSSWISPLWISISVSDSGKGLSQAELGALFESLRSKELVSLHNGFIEVDSRPDNVINQKVLKRQLLHRHYLVTVVNNGQEALDVLQTSTFSLILMDIVMPVMCGLEAIKHLRAREASDGSAPYGVIAVTGNARREQIDMYLQAGFTDVATKPYSFKSLVLQIEAIIGRNLLPDTEHLTFYLKPKPTRTLAENICALFYRPNMESMYYIQNIDRGPIPTIGMLAEHAFTIPVGLAPILIQSAAYWAFPNYNWPFAVAYPFYVVAFALFAHGVAERWNRIVMKHGCFDEKNFGRDRTPDTGVKGLARGLIAYMFYRTALTFYLHYESTENPLLSFTITYPLRLVAWLVTFDYFFYAYHRSCHEIPFLWNIHKKHHMLAGDYQECIEIALVPTLASLLIPMSFGELYLTLCYVMAAEAAGHSGARVVTQHPVLFFLKYFGAEMELEDHDRETCLPQFLIRSSS
ncbi:hypothetical protein RQP46_010775 [Phenoliferia psychrophenolica]